MIFHFIIHKTALIIAVERGYKEIVKLLLASPKIDVNKICISNTIFLFIKFEYKFLIQF